MKKNNPQFADLVVMDDPQKVIEEVKIILAMINPDFDCRVLTEVFADIEELFKGEYPGYQECDIPYHDLKHTTDVILALTRLVHGAVEKGITFSQENIKLALICAMLHDTGYILEEQDDAASGAVYTLVHVERSIGFMKDYLEKKGYSKEDYQKCRAVLLCTELDVKPKTVKFPSQEIELLGKMLGTADLLGQMADRTYLEKLLFLFYEFKDAKLTAYASEFDLLKKTEEFYELILERLTNDLSGVRKYMIFHFKKRFLLGKDFYQEAVHKNMTYLKNILQNYENEHRKRLRRGGVVKRLEERGLEP